MYDLFHRRQTVHLSRQDGRSDAKLSNTEVIVNEKQTILKLLQKGNNAKTPKSSADAPACSHTIFQIIIESQAVENGPIRIGRLSLIDLDRSEGAQVKNENGDFLDRSLEYLGLAITALSKGEPFRNHSKSKLTRLFKLGGNANVAIICNMTPTSLNQTMCTLNFADAAKDVKTKCLRNKVHLQDSVMKLLRDDINRLTQLKVDLEPLLQNTRKFDEEIADMESILVMEKDMKPRRHLADQGSGQVLKIRSFFASIIGLDKKYQIGEMKDKSVDAQSRCQRKCNAFKWTDFYLERVGFELNLDMRRHLKYGQNIIGRSDANEDVDICINSMECSRKHCFITISNDSSVSLKDLNSSNGTTVNGVKYKGKTIDLREGDVISIVGGSNNLSNLIGNFDCTVYRLCKSMNDQMQNYEIDDDVVIEINDDDDASYFLVKSELDLDAPPPAEHSTISEEAKDPEVITIDDHDDTSNDTCYFPVKMDLELETPPQEQPTQSTSLEEVAKSDVIIIDDDGDHDDGTSTSYFQVKMEFDTPQPSVFVEVNTETSTTGDLDFDLESFVFENVNVVDLEGIQIAPQLRVEDLSVPNLQTLAGELEELSKLQQQYETDNRMYAERIHSLETEIEQLNWDLNRMKGGDEANKDVIAELQQQLLASMHEKDALTQDNLKLSSDIGQYIKEIDQLHAKLAAVEKDRSQLREKNMKHINELMDHFNKKNRK